MNWLLNIGWWILLLVQQPRAESARVVIYRQKEFGGNSYRIYINGKTKEVLPPNRYWQVDVSPGRTKIESGKDYYTDVQTVWLTLQPGRTYYIKAIEEIDFLSRTLLMKPVDENQARQELRKIKPIESSLVNQLD
ncbi:hypothetical protein [Spirosoma sordidisoli]|nr:hypothetical protein [Spirosoma sordidisoli]